MAGCVFFVRGEEFNVGAFLESSEWQAAASVFHKGNKSALKRNPDLPFSGFNVSVSDPDDDVKLQLQKAIAFLDKHSSELQRLKKFHGVNEIELKFGSWWYEGTIAFEFSLPTQLISLAERYGIEITLCVYATNP